MSYDTDKGKFLVAYGRLGVIRKAELAAGLTAGTTYRWRKDDEDFDDAIREVHAMKKVDLGDDGLAAIGEIIGNPEHKDRFVASRWAAERAEGATPRRVEVRVTHEARLTLDALRDARVERPLTSAFRELPAASEVLAETLDD